MSRFSLDHFQKLLQTVTTAINGAALNQSLEDKLNKDFPPNSEIFQAIEKACHLGIAEGTLCSQEAGGIKFGRAIKPCSALHNFSVDLVHMKDVKGPHHLHPQGEIDLIMPLSSNATFDQRGAGWLVYGPDSSHSPTVSGGEALILYLLPNGEIKFTRP